MSRTRHILFLLPLLVVQAALPQHRPPIHWLNEGETIVIRQGETIEFEARFYSDIAIGNPAWCFSASLQPLFGVVALRIGQLPPIEPDRIYTIRVPIHAPANLHTKPYNGELAIFRWPRDPSESAIPYALPIRIYVTEALD